MGEEDAELLAAVCEGSERAFNRLIDRHQQAIRNFLRGIAAREDADDIAQDTFLAAWTHARSFRSGSSVQSWLFSIAWRKTKDMQRRWFRRRRRDTVWHDIGSGGSVEEAAGPERVALRRALSSLPVDQRAALMLCLAHGFTHAEAAETLDIPLGTIKSHVARGREKLRAAFGDEA